ncbi:hypothetical protein HPB49_012147 [Dermacentor silvarum]|uniref:Uncharacterized protein n=1 Tax=Dermacentor silvarum TaxID=543639 RepID=A0ACB8E0T8_DERSI|nr:hypothetical protein HPB49_012147 [Dermacentor silvarum]
MILRLGANQALCGLIEQLRDVDTISNVHELDITNCILADPDDLHGQIGRCEGLRSLRCVACKLRASDLLRLMLERLPYLAQVEFSLVAGTGVDTEIRNVRQVASRMPGILAFNLRLMYVEVGGYQNFKLLSEILGFCPNLTALHVHFVRGSFWNALLECHGILKERAFLESFTFTSELPAAIQREPASPLEFTSCAAVCANVSHQRRLNSWSCARLCDLALDCNEGRTLPLQLVVVAVHIAEFTAEWIRVAGHRHVWTCVRQLCLLLFPAEHSCTVYPLAGATYLHSLREFFSTAMRHLVELNVSSFHFGPDFDLTELLQEGTLKFLEALSAPPCGLCHPTALRRLAHYCPHLEDLDVRFDRQGSFVQCIVCECEFRLEPEDMVEQHTGAPLFRNGLARLTFSDVPELVSLRFLERCQMVTLRLSNCPGPSHPDYVRLGPLLANSSTLSCLVLRHDALPFGDASLVANLSSIPSLQYLHLLSATSVSGNEASMSVCALRASLPRLLCLHIHYRDASDGTEQRVTWIREWFVGGSSGTIQDSPCFLYCSTATFIGLAKPVNRHFQPIL